MTRELGLSALFVLTGERNVSGQVGVGLEEKWAGSTSEAAVRSRGLVSITMSAASCPPPSVLGQPPADFQQPLWTSTNPRRSWCTSRKASPRYWDTSRRT